MSLRRMFFGLGVVMAVTVWAWARPGDSTAQTQTNEPPIAESAQPGGNFDEASHHYRSGGSRHWRYVMVGNSH